MPEKSYFGITRYRVLFVAAIWVVTSNVFGQVDTGAVRGTVRDQTGAVVAAAKVTLIDEGTSFQRSALSQSDGSYVFTPVKIGIYTLTAEIQGFQKVVQPHISVNVQQQAVVDFTLQPGRVTQVVEVSGGAPLLQTQEASVGQVVGRKAIDELPLNGRNFIFLAQLTTGVTVGQPETRGMSATGSFSANGTRVGQNNYLLDGVDNNSPLVDYLNGTQYAVRPPVDAIQEFKVQTGNYSAELGRGAGAVLNATTRSGTNLLHGDVWEFLRNDKLDAADFFENVGGINKGEYRQNQFGFTLGGPVYLPRIYNGKDKTFFFADYEGTRIRQGKPVTLAVPTVAERMSGYTDFSDLIGGQGGTRGPDLLGRTVPQGTIFDPATTRPVVQGQIDPETGLTASGTGFVRDPFFTGSLAGVTDFTTANNSILLNQIPLGRLDPNAIKLFNLLPPPTGSGLFSNYTTNPAIQNDANDVDVRVDQNFSERNQMFAKVSFNNNPVFQPTPFPGIADGGTLAYGVGHDSFQTQGMTSVSTALSETHVFSPTLVNEARIGYTRIHPRQQQAFANDMSNIPAQFGIQAIPQEPGNGGLPTFGISGLTTMGAGSFLVSNEIGSTTQLTENLTKILGGHSFKGGFEYQRLKYSTTQPGWTRGEFDFDGAFTSIPNNSDGSTGRAAFLLAPIPATIPSGISNVGGPSSVFASNLANTDDRQKYLAAYVQDDWKTSPKLTLNLGVRWDYFGLAEEKYGAQGNFIPGGPFEGAEYLIPSERKSDPLSASFVNTLAADGIKLDYSNDPKLGNSQDFNFAPRVGFAYRFTPKLVVRGGYGLFYGGFQNAGYGPNIGENYPFQFSFSFFQPDNIHPITYNNPDGSFCSSATLETGFTCIPISPTVVNAEGLQLLGLQFNYITPYTQAANLTLGYEVSPDTGLEVAYVGSFARHLETGQTSNTVTELLPPGTARHAYLPYPDFSEGASYITTQGNSYYHSLQIKLEHRLSHGLSFLTAYTYAKTRTDALDLLNGGGDGGFRAPNVPGFGIQGDYGLANFDIRNAFRLSGGYDLPWGHGRTFLTDARGVVNQVAGGWHINWVLMLQDGQPLTIPCPIATGSGTGCDALLVPREDPYKTNDVAAHFLNASAFQQPPSVINVGQTDFAPLGGSRSQVIGPSFKRLDFSVFKAFQMSERTHAEFRAEFFNLTNHPNFAFPSFLNFTDPKTFGMITSTRDNPNDPRQIQFGLKFYW